MRSLITPVAYLYQVTCAPEGKKYKYQENLSGITYPAIDYFAPEELTLVAEIKGDRYGKNTPDGIGKVFHHPDTGDYYCCGLRNQPEALCSTRDLIFYNAPRQLHAPIRPPMESQINPVRLNSTISPALSFLREHNYRKPSAAEEITETTCQDSIDLINTAVRHYCLVGQTLCLKVSEPKIQVSPQNSGNYLSVIANYADTALNHFHDDRIVTNYFALNEMEEAIALMRKAHPLKDWQPDVKINILSPEAIKSRALRIDK